MRRHRFTATLIIPFLLCFLAPLCAQLSPSKNILLNGGFEKGFEHWTPDKGHQLLKGKKTAHTGEVCVTGEIKGPNKHWTLSQTVTVKTGNIYSFEIWARATNRTKLVLWVQGTGDAKRRMAATWNKLVPRWRRYRTMVSVKQSGTLRLDVIAPSSHGANDGKIWFDDATLFERTVPASLNLSQGKGYNDEPCMAGAGDGTLYAAWVSYRQGRDTLQVARYQVAGEKPKKFGAWPAAGGDVPFISYPQLVPAGSDVFLLYSAEVNGNWDVYAQQVTEKGPGDPVRITTGKSTEIKPRGVWLGGNLWLTWESNQGGTRSIWLALMKGNSIGAARKVNSGEASCYEPSIAALPGSGIAVAWHSFRHNNYDIYLRRFDAQSQPGEEQRLTKAPSIDRHAVLFTRGNELWVSYENAQTRTYHITSSNSRKVIIARIGASGLQAPKNFAESPLKVHSEGQTPVFDSLGRLWVAYLRPRVGKTRKRGWDPMLLCFSGNKCSPAIQLFTEQGLDRRPSLVISGGKAYAIFQSDPTQRNWRTYEDAVKEVAGNIYLATVDLTEAPRPQALELEPLKEPAESFEAGQIRLEHGEDTPVRSIDVNGKAYSLLYGDLHEHTDVSICNRVGDQSIDESYQSLRDIGRHQFVCITDHGYNIMPYLWHYSAKLARMNNDPGRYVTLLGEEWTSSLEKYSKEHPYGFYGHRNLVFSDMYFPRWWNARAEQTPASLWAELRKVNADFVQIPHQLADTGNVPVDWNYTDEKAQPVAEIFQTRGSYEYLDAPRMARRTTGEKGAFIQDAWARGIIIGVIASPDHGGGYGKACVYARERTRESILEGLRQRHCFGTTGAKIFLDVRVNGHLMGDKLPAPPAGKVEIQIHVVCPQAIKKVEVCRNNQFVYSQSPGSREFKTTFADMEPPATRTYYYVRVIQENDEIAWSSPVWMGYE